MGAAAKDVREVVSSPGLADAEAEARLRTEGYNELPRSERRTSLRIVVEVLREPMLALLVGGGVVYLLLGDLREALLLLAFGAMSIVITIVQEARTEHVLEALRDLTSPRALVIRDGSRRRIAGREVVRGDLVVLGEGDRVPADAMLFEARDLQADESLLTGESVPVRKQASNRPAVAEQRPGGGDQPFVYSGSLVVRGEGLAVVTATGSRSEIGKIGQSLQALSAEPPRLRQQTAKLVAFCGLGGAAVSVVAVLLYGTLRGDWLQALLGGIAIGMSMLPEEFPVVLTVFMAMGAWRISKARVLTRHAAAIETLGSATVLCTDKTGTLTQNRMSVAELRLPDGARASCPSAKSGDLDPQFVELARCSVLASSPEPFDPMEKAFHAFAQEALQARDRPDPRWTLVRSYGLRPELLVMSQAWQRPDAPTLVIAAKGAPEAIAQVCRLDDADRTRLRQAVDAMAENGLRVLGLATAVHEGAPLPQSPEAFAFRFIGLIGLADPLRSSVPEVVRECRSAGIRVTMITGDYPATALAIARQAGLDASHAMTGEQIRDIDDAACRACATAPGVRAPPDLQSRFHRISGVDHRSSMLPGVRGGARRTRRHEPPAEARRQPLFTWALIGWSVLQGAVAFALVALVFMIALREGMPSDQARALAFLSLVVCIFNLVLVNRSFSASFSSTFFRPNAALAWILLAVVVVLATVMLWPSASTLVGFGPIHPSGLMTALGAGVVLLVLLELLKPLWRARLRS